MRLIAANGILMITTSLATAASVDVAVSGVRSANGHVLVAACPKPEFLSTHCRFVGLSVARTGTVHVRIDDIPPGTYAIQVFHDENDNEQIDRNFFGLPTEGMGFSNNAGFHFGPPSFKDAAVSLGSGNRQIDVRLHYFTE
jgi:uncharacterized protein (DUF2141 family)